MVCCSGAGGWLPGQRVVISSLRECSEAALIWIFQQWHTQAEGSLSLFHDSQADVSCTQRKQTWSTAIWSALAYNRIAAEDLSNTAAPLVYYCFITDLITICSCRHSNTESCVDIGWHAINILMLCVHQYTQLDFFFFFFGLPLLMKYQGLLLLVFYRWRQKRPFGALMQGSRRDLLQFK